MNTHPIMKQDLRADGVSRPLAISEIFSSIQGEGPFAGRPATFVRMAGCNLCCSWCDTDYAPKGQLFVDDILAAVEEHDDGLVVLTGGEPFRQDITTLVARLHGMGRDVQIETNGTLSIPDFPWELVTLVCSPKAGRIHDDIRRRCRAWKYVYAPEDHALPVPEAATQRNDVGHPDDVRALAGTIYAMPLDTGSPQRDELALQAAIAACRVHGYTLCLQLHKIIRMR